MTNAKKVEDEIGIEEATQDGGSAAAEPSVEEAAFEPAPVVDEIEDLRAERDAYRDRFMRALADAENARKRSERRRA